MILKEGDKVTNFVSVNQNGDTVSLTDYDRIKRTTFINGESGFIENVNEKVKTKNHSEQIIEIISK